MAQDWKQVLKDWKLEDYISKFEDEGWDDIDSWNELVENNGAILESDGIISKKGHRSKFIRSYNKTFGGGGGGNKETMVSSSSSSSISKDISTNIKGSGGHNLDELEDCQPGENNITVSLDYERYNFSLDEWLSANGFNIFKTPFYEMFPIEKLDDIRNIDKSDIHEFINECNKDKKYKNQFSFKLRNQFKLKFGKLIDGYCQYITKQEDEAKRQDNDSTTKSTDNGINKSKKYDLDFISWLNDMKYITFKELIFDELDVRTFEDFLDKNKITQNKIKSFVKNKADTAQNRKVFNKSVSDEQVIYGDDDRYTNITLLKRKIELFERRLILLTQGIICVPFLDSKESNDSSSNSSIKPNKTIMVIGQTGTGKTTMLNSMMNSIYNTKFDNKMRYKLIIEREKTGGQAQSQTDKVSQYIIDPPNSQFKYTIIDTPGFGDTRGIKHDRIISGKIKKFFEEKCDEIHGICFVIRAPQARLTPTQKYVFDQILAIFGKDIADNIMILTTFADGKRPPALDAINEHKIPYFKHFKLNNSAFFSNEKMPKDNQDGKSNDNDNDDGDDDEFNEMFWKMGIRTFSKFFAALNEISPKSLTLTKKVLDERSALEHYILCLREMIQNGLTLIESLRKQSVMLRDNEEKLKASKNFTYTVSVPHIDKIALDPGLHTTTCLTCNWTCHKSCGIASDADKSGCWAMTGGKCRICPKKCVWNGHSNVPYVFKHSTKTETKTYDDLKAKYTDATSKKSEFEQIVEGTKRELNRTKAGVSRQIEEVRNSINLLGKIALKPSVLKPKDYFELMIQSEQSEKKPGYMERIEIYRNLEQEQDFLKKIYQEGDAFDPIAEHAKQSGVSVSVSEKNQGSFTQGVKNFGRKIASYVPRVPHY